MVRPPVAAALTLLALVLPAAAAPAPDEVDEAIAAFQERMKLASDPQARAYAVFELAVKHDPRVLEVLKPLLRHDDLDVRVAAARSVGEQGAPAVAGLLSAVFDREEGAKPPVPAFLQALLEGIGEADAKGSYKTLKKAAWKWLELDIPTSSAAARSMALARTAEAVGDLVDLMARMEERALDQEDGTWKEAFKGAADLIRADLVRLTGKNIRAIKDWRDWWKENGKGWKPPAPGAEAAKPAEDSDLWGDDAGKFTLRRPSKAWAKTDPGKGVFEAQGRQEGKVVAWLHIGVRTASELQSQTASAMAAERKPDIESDWKDIRKEATRWSQKVPFGGEKGVQHEVAGRHKENDACTMRYLYAVHDGVMYFVIGMCKAARDEPLRKEFDALFETFRFRK